MDRPLIASSGEDNTVRFWQPTIGRLVKFVKLPSVPLDIDWTVDGARVVAACQNLAKSVLSMLRKPRLL